VGWTKDATRTEVREEVFARDGRCIAGLVDPEAGPCKTKWGVVVPPGLRYYRGREVWTVDHVPRFAGSTRISSRRWMVTLCWGHHGHPSYWETAHRNEERKYLLRKEGPDAEDSAP